MPRSLRFWLPLAAAVAPWATVKAVNLLTFPMFAITSMLASAVAVLVVFDEREWAKNLSAVGSLISFVFIVAAAFWLPSSEASALLPTALKLTISGSLLVASYRLIWRTEEAEESSWKKRLLATEQRHIAGGLTIAEAVSAERRRQADPWRLENSETD